MSKLSKLIGGGLLLLFSHFVGAADTINCNHLAPNGCRLEVREVFRILNPGRDTVPGIQDYNPWKMGNLYRVVPVYRQQNGSVVGDTSRGFWWVEVAPQGAGSVKIVRVWKEKGENITSQFLAANSQVKQGSSLAGRDTAPPSRNPQIRPFPEPVDCATLPTPGERARCTLTQGGTPTAIGDARRPGDPATDVPQGGYVSSDKVKEGIRKALPDLGITGIGGIKNNTRIRKGK